MKIKMIKIFFKGDHDAILVLLMIPRIISKAELLASQIKDKVRNHGKYHFHNSERRI